MRRTTTTKALNTLLILGFGFSLGNAAFGQDTCRPQDTAAPQAQLFEETCQGAIRPAVDPSLTSVTRRTSLQAQITSTQDDQEASVEFRIGSDKGDSNGKSKSSVWHALKISGPINKNQSQTELVTLEGLQKNTKIGYVFSWRSVDPVLVFRSVTPKNFDEMLCEAHKEDKPNQNTDCKNLNPDSDAILFEELGYGSEPYKALLKKLGLAGSFLVGLEATYAAPNSFDFVTTDSLEVQSETHDGFAAALGVGWLRYQQGFYYLGLSYRYEEGYQSGKEQEICQPFGTDLDALSCAKRVVGAPTESKKQIASVEARRYSRDGSFALNPRFSYDFENSVSSVQLPVYFLKDGKGILNGGLTAGWRSDTDDFTLSLFVGTMKNPFK